MNNKKIFNNIKSKHILNYIFDYIRDKDFKDKLFLYSKKYQNKFGIKLVGLKENYLRKIGFDIDKYLYIEPKLFKKDFLTNKYNNFLIEKKVNKEIIEKIIYDIYENKEIKEIDEEDLDKMKANEKLIFIESPLFKILSKTKNFGKIFTIFISQKIIDEYKLKKKYKTLFDKLNNFNIKYSSIFYHLGDIKYIRIIINKIL